LPVDVQKARCTDLEKLFENGVGETGQRAA